MTDLCISDLFDCIRNWESRNLVQLINQLELIHRIISRIDRSHHAACKLIRACRRSNQTLLRILTLFPILLAYICCNCCMRIHHISGLFISIMDHLCGLCLRCISASEISQPFFHLRGNLIDTFFLKFIHQLCILLCVLPCDRINQTLQITGNQDIHGRRRCQYKLPVPVVHTGLEEIK